MSKNLVLVFFGDMGTGTEEQYHISRNISALNSQLPLDFIIGLGDNIYKKGVTGVNDRKFISHFENPYSTLPKKLRFYMSLGNHDYYGNVPAQIKYTKKSNKWYLPSNYYSFKKKIGKDVIEFFALDTNLDFMSNKEINKQKIWIINKLSKSNAKWKIVFGHHPWKSTGAHGDCDFQLNRFFKDISQYNFDIYLSGHDHDKQHIVFNDIDLVVMGTGAKKRPVPDEYRNKHNLKYFSNTLGYGLMVINKNTLKLCFFDENNEIEYKCDIIKN